MKKFWIILLIVFAVLETPAIIIIFWPVSARASQSALTVDSALTTNAASLETPASSEVDYLEDKYLNKTADELDAQAEAESAWIASQPGYSDNADPFGDDDSTIELSADGVPIAPGLYIDAGGGWIDIVDDDVTALWPYEVIAYQLYHQIDPLCFFDKEIMDGLTPIILQGQKIDVVLRFPEEHPVINESESAQIFRRTLTVYPLTIMSGSQSAFTAESSGTLYYMCYQKDAVVELSPQADYGEYFCVEVDDLPFSPSGYYAIDYGGMLILFQQPTAGIIEAVPSTVIEEPLPAPDDEEVSSSSSESDGRARSPSDAVIEDYLRQHRPR